MLVEKIAKKVADGQLWQPNERVLIAVSTGVDSMVLLDVLEKLSGNFGVAHVNHRLRSVSDEEALFLSEYCQQKKIPFHLAVWDTPATIGIEASARAFRYHFFQETMQSEGYQVLLTAHHNDDQIETILMKLAREGNFFSSAGIQETQPFGSNGRLVRPLLHISKEELLAYSRQEELSYFEDETNACLDIQRNRIRHQVVPALKAENSKVGDHFQQWSQKMLWGQELIQNQIERWLNEKAQVLDEGIRWDFQQMQQFSLAERYFFLQGCSQRIGLILSEKQVEKILDLIQSGSAQWSLDLAEGWHIRKSYQTMEFYKKREPRLSAPESVSLMLDEGQFISEEEWIGIFSIGAEKIPKKVKLWTEYRQVLALNFPFELLLRKRQAGDRLVLQPNVTKKVSRYFIDHKISNENRERAWILTDSENNVLGIVPYAFSYLSIAQETDKIHYVLLYRRMAHT